jgi:anti-sigma B factor antagonist
MIFGGIIMTIDKNIEGTKTQLKISGRLDTSTAPELESTIDACLSGVEELIIDFEGLEYVSSAGLRVILKTQKVMNKQGSMKIINVNDTIMEVFDITGFADVLTIE